MLTFSLKMEWDTTVKRWMVLDTQFGESSTDGDQGDVSDIHEMNLAMSQTLKIFEALDAPIVASTIKIVPGEVVANTITGTVLS